MDGDLVTLFFGGGLVALAVLVTARWALGRWERRSVKASVAPERIPPEVVQEIQGDFEQLTLRLAAARQASTTQWPARERLDLLEARHGDLPEFVQDLFDRPTEPTED
jgi:Na+-transporting methylmalonyl-CoA/oxaloacetate decarboxylase gamma subunit